MTSLLFVLDAEFKNSNGDGLPIQFYSKGQFPKILEFESMIRKNSKMAHVVIAQLAQG